MGSQHEEEKRNEGKVPPGDHGSHGSEGTEVLTIHVRADLYRAFRRCVWMTVHETGRSIVDIHNEMIEELLKNRQC